MLTALFGILAAALAIVGIYSVMSYTVAQRMRELAIRSALGASNNGLLQLVLREGFILSGIGIIVGLAGAFGASRLIRALLYQVSPTDPLVFGLTAASVAAAAVLGYVIPAFRASRSSRQRRCAVSRRCVATKNTETRDSQGGTA